MIDVEAEQRIAVAQARIDEAADTLRRLPRHGLFPDGTRSFWPDVVRKRQEAYGYDQVQVRPAAPTGREIDRLDEVLAVILKLDHRHRVVVWGRAKGRPWRDIKRRLRCGEAKLRKYLRDGLLEASLLFSSTR